MPFAGSGKQLEALIITEMYAAGIIKPIDPPEVQDRMKDFAAAIGGACEKWILAAGAASITGTVAPGQVTAGVSPAGPTTGATTSPGQIAVGSLI